MLALCQHNTLAYYGGIFDAGLPIGACIVTSNQKDEACIPLLIRHHQQTTGGGDTFNRANLESMQ